MEDIIYVISLIIFFLSFLYKFCFCFLFFIINFHQIIKEIFLLEKVEFLLECFSNEIFSVLNQIRRNCENILKHKTVRKNIKNILQPFFNKP